MKAKTRTNQPVEFENYDLPAGAKILGDVPFEQIKDAQGHNRFVEGDIDTNAIEGVDFTYAKWSLSGSHLMLVLAGSILNGTVVSFGTWASASVPKWIYDKIYPILSVVVANETTVFYSDNNTQSNTTRLTKDDNKLNFVESGFTLTADRNFRISFDLLIDNEQGE